MASGPIRLDEAIEAVLLHVMTCTQGDRAYVFHFRGNDLHNSHEVVSDGTKAFQQKLESITCGDIPLFSSQIRSRERVVVHRRDDLDPLVAALERREMQEEDISQLALVPVTAHGQDENPVVGFVGIDRCGGQELPWNNASIECLQIAGRFLFALHAFSEAVTGQPMLSFDTHELAMPPSEAYRQKIAGKMWGVLTQSQLFRLTEQYIAQTPVFRQPSAVPLSSVLLEAAAHFKHHRYAVLPPAIWDCPSMDRAVIEDFRQRTLDFVHSMPPDIEPYTKFRNVGYARYAYRNGSILPLLHKPFFQVDPTANALLQSAPRPFSRLAPEVREHPGLMHILRRLLEDVWSSELGPEVHLAVHPVLVRNFHEGALHTHAYATYEGTHVDSTMRVAVMLMDRKNVKAETARTSLYHSSCPIGKQRFVPEDEAEIAPLRLAEVCLKEPFQAITFDDSQFKHDASNPEADDPSKPMWRSVLLVMCRTPCVQASPLDSRTIDGFTPRSPRERASSRTSSE
jgi:hypothetical protein